MYLHTESMYVEILTWFISIKLQMLLKMLGRHSLKSVNITA